jgi:hypothetical protein
MPLWGHDRGILPPVCLPIFEAAALVAHPTLIEDLWPYAEGKEQIDQLAIEALAACEEAARSQLAKGGMRVDHSLNRWPRAHALVLSGIA